MKLSAHDVVATQGPTSSVTINLPTDEELANEGIMEFDKMITSLPIELGEKARNDEGLFKAYCGIRPEIGGMSGSLLDRPTTTLEHTTILIEAINGNRWARVIRHAHRGYSIVNLKATTRVIRNNPDYFPEEALLNPTTWIVNNPAQWYPSAKEDIEEVRYGLLSGFPLNACLKYVKYCQARRRLIRSVLPEETIEEAVFIINFVMTTKDPTAEELVRFIEILRSKGKGLFTEEEISLWEQKQRWDVEIDACRGFISFDESDEAWALAADDLYRKIKATVSTVAQVIL